MMKAVHLFVLLAMLIAAPCWAEGLDTLIAVGRSMSNAKATLNDETANFDRAKSALDNGWLANGKTRDAVRAQCGDPVVKNIDGRTKRERWVYKDADSSFFEGGQIWLYFDAQGRLDEVKVTY